ncbi:hypothetical protein [Piscinibacter sakaiensis]|uniref:hypothetical protein n=1 Tax=Piscinibacter sakaiensis TaxID=1547922 RepID=UPI003AB0E73D
MSTHQYPQHFSSRLSRLGAVLAIMACSAAASAIEATEFEVPASVKSRAQVQQELQQAQRENPHLSRRNGSESDAFEQVREFSRETVRSQITAGQGSAQNRELFGGG